MIPKLNDSFNIVVSEVYYDKTMLTQIYNDHLHLVLNNTPTDEELKTKYKKYLVKKMELIMLKLIDDLEML